MKLARICFKFILIAVFCSLYAGCASLNSIQKAELEAMKVSDAGIYVEEKKKSTAIALGFLPGGGSFYTEQHALGVTDLLLWPLSILWDPVSGSGGAEVINYNLSKNRARVKMKREMDLLEVQRSLKDITLRQYYAEEKRITDKYTFDR